MTVIPTVGLLQREVHMQNFALISKSGAAGGYWAIDGVKLRPLDQPSTARKRTMRLSRNLILTLTMCLTISVPCVSGEPNQAAKPAKKAISITYDQYGGVNELVSPHGPSSSFRVEMFGGHWLLVTPEGHGMWMKGIFDAAVDTHIDARGSSHQKRILAKYGN